MTQLLIISGSSFLIAFVIGWWRYTSFYWNFVDLIYYPLAATGVMLLFLSNDVQRELFEVSQLADKQRSTLDEMRGRKPNVQIPDSSQLLTTHLDGVQLISRWGDICNGGPASAEARCLAVSDLVAPVREFLESAQARATSYEDRLLATCQAADRLIDVLRKPRGVPSLVGEKLSAHYALTTAKKPYWLDYGSLDTALSQFRDETLAYVEQIQRLAFKPGDQSGSLFLEIRKSEIEYAEMIFRGLYPCMTAPRAELGNLSQWTAMTSTQAEEVARMEAERTRLKASPTPHSAVVWIQLNLWPLVLLAALSLKFAKGAATLRKARKSAA